MITNTAEEGRSNVVKMAERSQMVVANPKMLELVSRLETAAKNEVRVLLSGETGVGKEVFAREIHRLSKREKFVAVDCGSLSDTLIESELFGHKKGSFTGANSDKDGFFKVANKGILFLDEIGKLPQKIQAKLLRTLDNYGSNSNIVRYRRVGSTEEQESDIFLIFASSDRKNIMDELFYRISTFLIEIPSLRQRADEIVLLVKAFLQRTCIKYGKACKDFSPDCYSLFKVYSWPGNVRQLETLVTRAVLLTKEDVIGIEEVKSLLFEEEKNTISDNYFNFAGKTLKEVTYSVRRQLIIDRLVMFGGNIAKAAESLGIFRGDLYKYIRDYEIDRSEYMPVE